MNYINSQEAAKITGISPRRIQQMCKENIIEGAIKDGKSWLIPSSYFSKYFHHKGIIPTGKKALPIGVSNYIKTVRDYYYVDKTMIIKEIIDSKPEISLITRPRRFGKTLTMDMIRTFFEISKQDTSRYFIDKKIWALGEEYTVHQGKYPVIYLSFKDIKRLNYENTIESLKHVLHEEFERHSELLTSTQLNDLEKNEYLTLIDKNITINDMQYSLRTLSRLLNKHYGIECIILIDEYDTPITEGYSHSFYTEIINFMRNFFSSAFKDNPFIKFGFLTGVLRIAKESIFSGLNNVKTSSVLDENFSEYFGFTIDEVKELLHHYEKDDKLSEVCKWYDGYKFANKEIFNPWSVLCYLDNHCIPDAYWQSTGNNELIGELIYETDNSTMDKLYKLISGESITYIVDTNIVFSDLRNNSKNIFSFLLLTGYLTISKTFITEEGYRLCELRIPNKEIFLVYNKEIISRSGKENISLDITQAFINNDIECIKQSLSKFLIESVSIYDGTNESFYHGMMLGLCATLSNKYHISSNIESGYGRLDIELCPKQNTLPAFIFELKYSKDEKDLDSLASKALDQINNKEYDTKLKANGITNICKLGIAFSGKKYKIKI